MKRKTSLPGVRGLRSLRRLEAALLVCGAASLAFYAAAKVEASVSGRAAERYGVVFAGARAPGEAPGTALPPSDVMGRIQVPQLGLSAPITNDISSIDLVRGVGHVPGTAVAGGLGTMALAGHRDTFFRSLRLIKAGMQIRISSEGGVYRYVVDSTEVVTPEQVSVLDIRSVPELVLVTCYPFNYIGAAPRRFVVHAHLLSLLPDEK